MNSSFDFTFLLFITMNIVNSKESYEQQIINKAFHSLLAFVESIKNGINQDGKNKSQKIYFG